MKQIQQIISFPEKCCAKCGFMYAQTRNPGPGNEFICDPDLLREPEYYTHILRGDIERGQVSTQIYFHLAHRGSGNWGTTEDQILHYTWVDVFSICCLYNQFHPIHITKNETVGRETFMPMEHDHVSSQLLSDKSFCEYFFEYHPGLSPLRHAELRLQDIQYQRQKEHEQALVKWSLDQEERIHSESTEAETRWRNFEHKITVRLALIGAVIALLAAILQPIVTCLISR